MRWCLIFVALLSFGGSAAWSQEAHPDRPQPQISRVMIISIDGLRPDVLLRADTPHLHHLMDTGSFTMWAKTTPQSITLPSHVSMLTGVVPEVHAILWNSDLPFSQPVYPSSPTLFELARRAGYTTALVVGKSKFNVFDQPAMNGAQAALSWKYLPASPKANDRDVTAAALQILHDHQPEVMFVHFPDCDTVGHAIGWGTPEQLQTVVAADQSVGQILDELDTLKLRDSTSLIITADHGGAGRTHGPDDPRSRTIPWIAVGPGIIRKNL